jgi:hypothetical protein
MQKIKLFLASSSELKEDREQFEIFLYRKCKAWFDRGIFLHLELWEDFLDAMAPGGLQSEYNTALKDCDIFVLLAFNKVGKYTAEEFGQLWRSLGDSSSSLSLGPLPSTWPPLPPPFAWVARPTKTPLNATWPRSSPDFSTC